MPRPPRLFLAVVLFTALPRLTVAQISLPRSRDDAPAANAPTSYDAVSIHEHAGGDNGMMWRTTPDGFNNSNIQLYNLAAGAYSIKMDLVSGGPSWVYDKGFDTTARLLPGDDGKVPQLSEDQRNELMRNLLADRFHLRCHVETKILPTYDLVIAKGGVHMKVAPPPPSREEFAKAKEAGTLDKLPPAGVTFGPGHLVATRYAVANLADQLGYMVNKTVVDKTGLTGNYDLTLDFTPDDQLAHPNDAATSGADLKPDIFTAIQEQLGLKLLPSKGPVRTLVIDHAELPTPN